VIELERFNRRVHADNRPWFVGKYIIPGAVSVAEITFRDTRDEPPTLADARSPEECPDLQKLSAWPYEQPVIPGHGPRQELTVLCSAVRRVAGNELRRVCGFRAKEAGYDPNNLPPEAVTNDELYRAIRCPFGELKGVAEGVAPPKGLRRRPQAARALVAVSAEYPRRPTP
jgi:hypothetical protein